MLSCLKKYKKSFTLVELSIVLGVLGILVASTLSATTIMNNAKATKIVQDIQNYRQAVHIFQTTFNSLPGDYGDAQYRLAPSGYATYNVASASLNDYTIVSKIPLNGDQDGSISNKILTINNSIYYSEAFGVWSHLSANKLLDVKYSNIGYVSEDTSDTSISEKNNNIKVGYNLPKVSSGVSATSAYILYKPQITSKNSSTTVSSTADDSSLLSSISNEDYVLDSHILLMVDVKKAPSDYVFGTNGAINSLIMSKIDSKIDDGRPMTGLVFGLNDDENKGCNTYTDKNEEVQTHDKNYKIAYSNQASKNCVGVVVLNEFD